MSTAGRRGGVSAPGRGWCVVPGALVLVMAGCALPGGRGPAPGDPCRVSGTPEVPGLIPVIGVVDPVDFARAPHARSDGEGLLFATIHPPLVRLDCTGRLHPAVASSWEPVPGDGEPAWRLAVSGEGAQDDGVARALARSGGVEGVERTASGIVLRFGGDGGEADGARVLAQSDLVPVVPTEDGWGSRLSGLRLTPVAGPGPGRTLHLVDDSGEGERTLAVVRVVPGGDPRDLLDRGAHLVLTRDPLAVAWAGAREGLQVVPLPPDRVYRLAIPGETPDVLPAGLSAGLVRDVFPLGEVPRGEGGRDAREACPAPRHGPPDPGARRSPSPRVVFPLGDPVARGLAERVAALAGPGEGAPLAGLRRGLSGSGALLEVVGLESTAFGAALRAGGDAAYVVPEPLHPAAPCVAQVARLRRIPWLGSGSLLALLESGPRALVRPGAPPLEVDGTGAVRMILQGRGR